MALISSLLFGKSLALTQPKGILMDIQSLKFSYPEAAPEQNSFSIETREDLEKLKKDALPVAHLVNKKDLSRFLQFDELVIARGIKNEHKGLSQYLLRKGADKIQIIDGNYSVSGKLRTGIRALLSNASADGQCGFYIIGAEDRIFHELWDLAAETTKKKRARQNCPSEKNGADVATCNSFMALLGHCHVPKDLVSTYVGTSSDAHSVRVLITLAARNENPVLILGETGTGKEVVAREIHKYSEKRCKEKFIPVNCGAIPEELFESELFGHVKGAFTGADFDKEGLWKTADKGTLFLDEIGEMHLNHQVKILRALDQGKIRPVGATKDIKVDTRVLAATNRDLLE